MIKNQTKMNKVFHYSIMIILSGMFIVPTIMKTTWFKDSKIKVEKYFDCLDKKRKQDKLEDIMEEQIEIIEEINEIIEN